MWSVVGRRSADLTFVLLYDAPCDGKSKAITTFAAVSRFVDTIKSLKDLLFLTLRDFFSAIGDRKEDLFIFLIKPNDIEFIFYD